MKKIITLAFISCLFIATKPAEDFVATLKQKLEEYVKYNPVDQAILIFNQDKYAIADTAFFQVYLLNEDMTAVKGKKILSLSIYDSNGKAIQKTNFSVVNGRANNQMAISALTAPGVYLFTVSYAQNMDDASAILFTKEIAIVEKRQLSFRTGSSSSCLLISYEGGFVSDVENTLIIQSTKTGTGRIKNSRNEEVAQFTAAKNKITTLSFSPQKGESYFAEMESEGVKIPLMAAKSDGCIIKMAELSNASTRKITILTPLQSEFQKRESYLIVTNRRKIAFSTPIAFDPKGRFEVNLPKDAIKNGISYATVLDQKGTVISERVFFKYEPTIVTTLTPLISEASPRKKITLDLSSKDVFGNSVQGDFSVSVYQKELFKNSISHSFVEEVLVPYPYNSILTDDILRKELTEEKLKFIDYALAGRSNASIPWSLILTSNNVKPTKSISSSLKLKGKVIYKNSGKSVPDSTLIMGYLQNNMIGYVGHTLKDGRFELPFLYDFFGDDQLFYILEQNGKEVNEPFEILPDDGRIAVRPQTGFTLKDSIDLYGEYVEKKRIVEKSYNFYGSKRTITNEVEDLNTRFEEEAMGVDMSVNVQDYISFPTMEDLVREVIPFLQNKKKGNTASVRLLINQNIKNTNYVTAKGEPLFIIDGILTKNINSFLGLKPVDILTIKIINDYNKLNRLGPLGKNGVVLVKTKKPSNSTIIANSTILNIQGLTSPSEYRNIDYNTFTNNSMPDIRASLMWSPSLNLNQSGKAAIEFFTSDKMGTFDIVVRGLSLNGEPFETVAQINISFH
ncbi:MAG: hypothetical protein HYZ44_12285 [Bacteroidetes bacterium]|nr:hypothetical protein [Bacteroidota bacterium]